MRVKYRSFRRIEKITTRLRFLYRTNRYLSQPLRRLLCNAITQPHFDYTCLVWYHNLDKIVKTNLQTLKNKCIIFCLNLNKSQGQESYVYEWYISSQLDTLMPALEHPFSNWTNLYKKLTKNKKQLFSVSEICLYFSRILFWSSLFNLRDGLKNSYFLIICVKVAELRYLFIFLALLENWFGILQYRILLYSHPLPFCL